MGNSVLCPASRGGHIVCEWSISLLIAFIRIGGTVSIASVNPLDAPIIDSQILTAKIDTVLAREAIKHQGNFFLHKRSTA